MVTVALHGAEFFARHGYYPEEQVLGNQFIVDVEVSYEPDEHSKSDELAYTVNYEELYKIAQQEMHHTRQLLETVAQSIVDAIRRKFAQLKEIRVVVRKLNPPLAGKVKESAITITYTRD